MRADSAMTASRALTGATQGLDNEQIESQLQDFLGRQPDLGGLVEAVHIDTSRRSAGASSGTVLFDVELKIDGKHCIRRLVFRYDLGGAFFSQYSLTPQFSIMQGLRARGLPVPKALWLDAAGTINGMPGLIMERIEGIAPSTVPFSEGPYVATDAAGRHAMLLAAARTIAAVHKTAPEGLADEYFAQRGGEGHFIDREIGWNLIELRRSIPPADEKEKTEFYRDVRETLEHVACWLTDNAPRHREPELAHGDANISNFMYDAEGKVIALLDWELTHMGLGEADLAYQIAGIAHFSLLAPPIDGIPFPEEMVEAYRDARGKLDDWPFAQILGEWRLAVFASMGMSRLPADLADVERTYWREFRQRLSALVPGIPE